MSLKQTFKTIESIALGTPLINQFYFKRWSDTIDKTPCFITAKVVKSLRNSYEIDFTILDFVSDRDKEYDEVRSDTLMTLKSFFSTMSADKLLEYNNIEFEPIDDNQLTGWKSSKVVVFELNQNCTY